MSLDLDAIRARANHATPGPWSAADLHDGDHPAPLWGIVNEAVNDPEADDGFEAQVLIGGRADAEFIAHSREDVTALLDEVERLTGPLGRRTAQLAATEADRDRLSVELAKSAVEIERMRQLLARVADELEDLSQGCCWQGNFAACDNGGCAERRALLAEARATFSTTE